MDTSPAVNVETMETDTTPPTLAGEPTSMPSCFTPTTSVAATSCPPLTKAILYKMGHLTIQSICVLRELRQLSLS